MKYDLTNQHPLRKKGGQQRDCKGFSHYALASFFSLESTEPRMACNSPQAALFAPIGCMFWRVLPFSNASYGLLTMLIFELKPVHTVQTAHQTRVSHFLRLAPLDTAIEEENTESSTLSFGPCHITQCASALKYLCNKVILCLCRVPGFFIITQTFNIWCPSSTGKVKGVC